MTTRNFDALFRPSSIALVGASNKEGSVGAVIARNLLGAGFHGPIMTVNPHEEAILSTLNYHSVRDLPTRPDLAVIATPPQTVPGLIDELGRCGCRAAIVVTAGFESASDTPRESLVKAAQPYLMRIVGPNCLGFLSPGFGINASFSHLTPQAGDIAFVTQSGAIATTMLDWGARRGVGFSHVVSLGDMSDADFGDMLDYLALDPGTRAILLYVEMVTQSRKFMSAARIAARAKPVIVVKAGRSQAGANAAMSHTGALAGSDAVYDAAFRRAGILRVRELRDLFDAAQTLSTGLQVAGNRLTIITNGGGLGVLAVDALEEEGGMLADLSEQATRALDAVLPKTWSHHNPIDILGDAHGDRYNAAINVVRNEPAQDALLLMNCPTGVADAGEAADAVLATAKTTSVPILTCWVGGATAEGARQRLAANKLPSLETPNEAVRAFMQLANYRRNQELLLETPRPRSDHNADARGRAQAVIDTVLADGRTVLTAPEAKTVLAAYKIPVIESRIAGTPAEAAQCARAIGRNVALKILSPDISHKSDLGGVRLNLSADAVEAEAQAMLAGISQKMPSAHITGFTVEEQIETGDAHELILGASVDRTFGPVLLFGQGGIAVEIVADRAMGLPPLNSVLAKDMISRTRVSKLLRGYRNIPPANEAAIVDALVALSDVAIAHPHIVEIDINPLLADSRGVRALDARISLRTDLNRPELAIRPYPIDLEREIKTRGGETLFARPIRPEDEAAIIKMVAASSPEDRRLRILGALKTLDHELAARLTQIDYDREMAFIALKPGTEGDILGIARIVSDPNFSSAELALMVRTDMKRHGIGYALAQQILSYAALRGITQVWGDVDKDNEHMLELARSAGASLTPTTEDLVRATFSLAGLSANRQTSSSSGA